jgi:hypothetical protein
VIAGGLAGIACRIRFAYRWDAVGTSHGAPRAAAWRFAAGESHRLEMFPGIQLVRRVAYKQANKVIYKTKLSGCDTA